MNNKPTRHRFIDYAQNAQPIQQQLYVKPKMGHREPTPREKAIVTKIAEVALITWGYTKLHEQAVEGEYNFVRLAIHQHAQTATMMMRAVESQEYELSREMLLNLAESLEQMLGQSTANHFVDLSQALRENATQSLEPPEEKRVDWEVVLEAVERQLNLGERLSGKATILQEKVVRRDTSRF